MFYFSQQTAQIIYPVAQKSLDSKKIPYFLEGPVNGDNYLDILQNYVVPGLIMHLLRALMKFTFKMMGSTILCHCSLRFYVNEAFSQSCWSKYSYWDTTAFNTSASIFRQWTSLGSDQGFCELQTATNNWTDNLHWGRIPRFG